MHLMNKVFVLLLSVTNTDISLHWLLLRQTSTYEFQESFKSPKHEDMEPSIEYVASYIFWSSLQCINWQIISFLMEETSANKYALPVMKTKWDL
jgi:hypothetical protein